jgi:uroporphyrinogen-III synthase
LGYEPYSIDYSRIEAKYSEIIITSKYAARLIALAISNLFTNCDRSFWIVGEASSRIIYDAVKRILKQPNMTTVQDISTLISRLKNLETRYDRMLYLSGDKISRNLPSFINRTIIYRTEYRTDMSETEKDQLNVAPDYALLYSSNAARALLNILDKYDLLYLLKSSTLICISEKVSKLLELYAGRTLYPSIPKHQEVLKLLLQDLNSRPKLH